MPILTSLYNLTGIMLAAAAPAGHGDSKEVEGVFPPFDPSYFPSQIFWLLLSFFTLYFILKSVFLPRVGGIIEQRSNRIADDLDNAARMQREAEDAERAYERALSDAKAKAHNVAESTRQSINDEVATELEAADAKAAEHALIAEERIKKIRTEALSNIDDIASNTASEIVAKLIGKAPTKAQLSKVMKG